MSDDTSLVWRRRGARWFRYGWAAVEDEGTMRTPRVVRDGVAMTRRGAEREAARVVARRENVQRLLEGRRR